MPELPEVETVRKTLEKQLVNKMITEVLVLYPNIVETKNITKFCEQLKGQTIRKMQRRGKWLMFILDDYVLFSHLRMEGKYFFKTSDEPFEKH